MSESLLRPGRPAAAGIRRADGAQALERAALAIGRLDTALRGQPLLQAWVWRTRLDAVRRQAAADGRAIEPWQLAAVVAGVRLRLPATGTLAERGLAFDAARHALTLWRWHASPDQAQERLIAAAAATLPRTDALLPGVARAVHAWLDGGGERAPLRAALARWWPRRGLLPVPVPLLTGARALHAEVPWALDAWPPRFFTAVAEEAESGLALLQRMQRQWFAARAAVAGRRRDSHAAAAIDVLAAAPLLSAASLARGLDVSIKSATALLDDLAVLGVVVEVSRRQKRRLWGLAGLAPLRAATAAPRRPLPGRGRGRPRRDAEAPMAEPEALEIRPAAQPPLSPLATVELACPELDRWMREVDLAIGRTRAVLDAIAAAGNRPGAAPDGSRPAAEAAVAPATAADDNGRGEGAPQPGEPS